MWQGHGAQQQQKPAISTVSSPARRTSFKYLLDTFRITRQQALTTRSQKCAMRPQTVFQSLQAVPDQACLASKLSAKQVTNPTFDAVVFRFWHHSKWQVDTLLESVSTRTFAIVGSVIRYTAGPPEHVAKTELVWPPSPCDGVLTFQPLPTSILYLGHRICTFTPRQRVSSLAPQRPMSRDFFCAADALRLRQGPQNNKQVS
jgi:hypothetical protein